MIVKIMLSYLLNAANSNPWSKNWFYPIKESILNKWGHRIAWDQQHIIKKCWSCNEGVTNGYDNGYCWVEQPYHPCTKCNGTGIYDKFWVLLEVWNLGKYEFHIPIQSIRDNEFFDFPKDCGSIWLIIRNKIEGIINHDQHPMAKKAFWILAFFYTPRKFYRHWLNVIRNKIMWPWRKLNSKFNLWRYRNDEIPF